MNRILILLATLLVAGCPQQVYNNTSPATTSPTSPPITQEEVSAMSGLYRFEGDWKDASGKAARFLWVEALLVPNSAGQLTMHLAFVSEDENILRTRFNLESDFRRLTAAEWLNIWKVEALPGSRCDVDRHCFISKLKGSGLFTWRLWQFSDDYKWMQTYAIFDQENAHKGHGYLAIPTTRVAESKSDGWWEGEVQIPDEEPAGTPTPEPTYRLIGTGTGFLINKNFVVTAEHVLQDCNAVSIRHGHKEIKAKTVARDTSNDLGLIRLQKPIGTPAKLRGGKRIRLGEMVANYGYPLFGQLSTSATITGGNINNLSGAGNDSTVLQFDAPTQPGNSGGPLLDSSGNVVGVAIQILSKRYADATGHIAQNVNFTIKSTILEVFLKANKVSYEKADSIEELKLPDIAEKAEAFTVLVGCWE